MKGVCVCVLADTRDESGSGSALQPGGTHRPGQVRLGTAQEARINWQFMKFRVVGSRSPHIQGQVRSRHDVCGCGLQGEFTDRAVSSWVIDLGVQLARLYTISKLKSVNDYVIRCYARLCCTVLLCTVVSARRPGVVSSETSWLIVLFIVYLLCRI